MPLLSPKLPGFPGRPYMKKDNAINNLGNSHIKFSLVSFFWKFQNWVYKLKILLQHLTNFVKMRQLTLGPGNPFSAGPALSPGRPGSPILPLIPGGP